MADAHSMPYDFAPGRPAPMMRLIVLSLLFHAVILVGIPVATKLIWQPKKFSRPQTFRLVTMPPPKPIRKQARIQEEVIPKEPNAKKTHVPKKADSAPAKENTEPEESLDDLASLLNEMPVPTAVSTAGEFKWNWYIMNVQMKIERNWMPSVSDRNISVVVAFTIFPTGTISEPKIAKSSGNVSLDNLGIRAIKLAAPFGKLPPGFVGNQLELRCDLKPVRR